jgi:hypothetical protein
MSLELIYDLVEGRMLNDGRFESRGVVVGSYIKIKIIKKFYIVDRNLILCYN